MDKWLDPDSQPTGSWWAAGSGLSTDSPPLEGFLMTPSAQPELGRYDLALPFPSGHLLKMCQTPLSNRVCVGVQPHSVLGGHHIEGRHVDCYFFSQIIFAY